MNSSNPAFAQNMFAGYDQVYGATKARSTVTTVQGTVGKTFLLLAILSFTAIWSWNAVAEGSIAMGTMLLALIGGAIMAMITIGRPSSAPVTAPIYAAIEGVFLGALSQVIETRYHVRAPGIALQAVVLTTGTLFLMLFVFQTGLVRVTDKLKAGIITATGALGLFYMVTILLRLFGVQMPLVWSASPMGIGFSLLVIGLAAFNLLLDFDFIQKAAYAGAPKYMEWYGAFGLILTLVWLYLEILRLLQKMADRR